MIPESVHRALQTAAVCLLVAIVAFSAGRFSAPVEVDTRTEYRTEWRTKETIRWKAARDTKTTKTPVLLPTPDGGVVLATTTTIETRDRVDGAAGTETAGNTADRTAITTTLRPDWRVGVQAGASMTTPAIPIAGPFVLGVQVDRRIFGGVSAGVWANSAGAAGVALSGEF